jgi:hypothetical protein
MEGEAKSAAAESNSKNDKQQGRGRGNQRNNNKGRRNNKEKAPNKPEFIQKEKFTGRSDDLEGYIYSVVSTKGGVQFTRTTEEIARYAGAKYPVVGSHIRTAILTMTEQVPTRPTAPTAASATTTVDPVDQAIFNEEVRQFVKDKAAITAAMKALYSVAWGQCSEALRSKLKSNPDYNTFSAAADSLHLLQAIRSEMTGFKRLHYLPHSVHSILREFYSLTQGKHRTNQEYYDEFNTLVDAVDECGAMMRKQEPRQQPRNDTLQWPSS